MRDEVSHSEFRTTRLQFSLQAMPSLINPWLIAVTVMSATFMEVLDSAVVNVARRHIAGAFASSADEATWVLTSYLISNAIVLVGTRWLSSYFGRKRMLSCCLAIFTIASVLCGAAPNLPFLIVARVIQGIGGGTLQPTAQAVLLESFPPSKRGQAMCMYTLGVMVAPLMGPTLGGWVADNYSWRWIFYLNLPVGVFAIAMTQIFIVDPPYLRRVRGGRIDYLGFALMAVGLGALQVVLDKGQRDDWFSSGFIRTLTTVAVLALGGFIFRELSIERPIVNLRALGNRNFAVGVLLVTAIGGAAFYGVITLLPLFTETILGYTATLSGETLAWRGVGALIATGIVWRLSGKIDTRLMLSCGFGLLALSVYMLGDVNLEVAQSAFLWPGIINGFGFGLISAPLTTIAVNTLRTEQISNATGIFNLMRNVGGGIGVSVVTTLLARREQWHQRILASRLTPNDWLFKQRLQQMGRLLGSRRPYGLVAGGQTFLRQSQGSLGTERAYGLIYGRLLRQSALLAFVDIFRLLAVLCVVCVPLAFIFKKMEPGRGESEVH